MNESDDELMRILAKGDEAAFRILFARHGSLVFGYCMRILQGDRSVAEDICQNVWMKIIRSAPDYQGQGNFRAWLLTITRNASYEYFRKERRWVDQEEDELEEAHKRLNQDSDESAEDPETILIVEGQRQEAIRAIEALPMKQRIVLTHWLSGEESYAGIAEEMGISLAQVKILVHRAKKKLIEILRKKQR